MVRSFVLACLAALAVSPVHAALVLGVGEWTFDAGTGMQIPLTLTSGDPAAVAGMTLIVQIGDGGPELEPIVGGTLTDGPAITGLNLLAPGALFASSGGTPVVVDNFPQLRSVQITTGAGTVNAGPGSLLGVLTVDTSGFAGGDFTLSLGATLAGDTQLNAANGTPLALTIQNGMLHVNASSLMPDLNMDGFVDIFDVNLVSDNWGTSNPAGDANKDGIVDIFDVNVISDNWSPQGGVSAVPEPATAALSVAGVAGLWLARRGWRRPRQ